MGWDVGVRICFLVSVAAAAAACVLASKVSMLPRVWSKVDAAVIGLVGVAGIVGLGAEGAIAAGGVLLLVLLAESIGLWLAVAKRRLSAGRAILIVGGTLCVLFAGLRFLGGAVRAAASTESMAVGEVLADALLQPLFLFVGSLAIAIGCWTTTPQPQVQGLTGGPVR